VAFTVFTADTTVGATEMNDNFLHVGQGDLIPRTGTTLLLDDSVTSNLGSDDYRWKTIYTTNVNITGNLEGAIARIAGVTMTTTATSIEFTNLNGDSTGVYFIHINCFNDPTAATQAPIHFNNDSGSNYGYQIVQWYGSSWVAGRGTGTGLDVLYMARAGTTTTRMGTANLILYAKTGAPRLMLESASGAGSDHYLYLQQRLGGSWNNTADTLTSIKFNPGTHKLRTGTTIDIYSIVKI